MLLPHVSAILNQAFDDEDATYAESAIAANVAIGPTLCWFELRNALLMGERRQRLTVADTASFLADTAVLPFEMDDSPREATVLDLARINRLAVYAAACLELAQRKQLTLATIDRALSVAANAAGVALFHGHGPLPRGHGA